MPDLQQIVEKLSQLTVMEAAELSRMLEDKWGVSAAAPVVQAVEQVQAPVPTEQQTEFTAFMTGFDAAKKINVIKEVRTITGLGLKEAKEFTEAAGPNKQLKEGISKDEAERLKTQLQEAGATVEIR